MNEINYPDDYVGQFDSQGRINFGDTPEELVAQETLNTLAGLFISHAGLPDDKASRLAINSIFLAESNFISQGGPMMESFSPSFYYGIGTALNALRSTVTGTLQNDEVLGRDIITEMHQVIAGHYDRQELMGTGGDC